MDHTLSDLQTALTPVFSSYGITRAVLFGSQAKGTADLSSDLDLLVDVFDVRHIQRGSRLEREILATGVTIYEGL